MTAMKRGKITVSRPLVGLIALACLCSAAAIWYGAPPEGQWRLWRGAFVRVGLVMAAFWLVLPARGREAAWANFSPATFFGLLIAVAGIAMRPRVFIPLLIAVAILGFLLRPRRKRRPQERVPPDR